MKLTNAQRQVDPKTGKIIEHFGEKSIFTITVKRHNGRQKIIGMGSGSRLKELLDEYNAYQVFTADRKYLFHRLVDEPVNSETKVLMENGKGESRLASNHTAGRKKIDYESGEISVIKSVPVTLLSEFDEFINHGYVINSQVMTKTRLISILLAELLQRPVEDRIDFLARGDLLLERHKLACGGLSGDRLQKTEAHQQLTGEDLL